MPDSPDTFTKLSARRLFYYSKESRIPRLGDVRPPPRSRWEQNQMETFETESSNELSQNEILYRAVALLESIGVAFSEAVKYSYDDSEELKSKQPSIAKKENRPIPPHIKTNFKSEVFLKSSSPTDVLTEGPTLSLNLNRPKLNVTKQPIENKSIQDVSQKTFQPYPQQNQVDTSLNNFGQDLSTADLMATLPPEQFSSAAALALGSTSIDLTSKVMRRLLMVENSGSDISRERFNNTKNGISRAMTLPVMPSIENPTHPVSLTPLKQRMKSPETWTSQTIKSSNQSELNNGSRSRAESTESTHSNKSTIRKVQSRTKPSSPQRSRTVSSPYTSPYLSSSENPHSMPPRKPPIPTFKKADSKASSKPTSPSNDFKNPSLSMKNLENSTQSAEVPFSTSSSSPNTSQKIKSTPKLVSLDQVTTPYFTPRKTTPQSSAHPSPSPSRKNIDEAKTISVPFLSSSSVSPTLLPRKPPIPVFRKRKASSTTTDTMSTDIAPYESALTEVVLLNEPSPAQELLPQENTNKITSHALNRMEVVVADNLLSGHEDVTDAKPSQVSDMEAIEALTSTHSSGLSIPSPISEARSDESDVFSRPVFKPPLAVQNTPLAASVTPLSFSTLNSLRADSYPTSQTTKMLRSPKVSTSRLPSITQLHNEEELENSDGGVKEQDITQSLDRNPRILAKQGSEDSSMSNHGRIYRIGMKIHRSVDIETPSSSSDGSSVFGVFTRSSDLTDGSDDLSLRGPNSTFESETGGLPNQIPLVVTTSYDDDMLLEEIRKSKKESEVDLNVAQIQDTKDTEANDNVVPSNLEATSQLVSEKRKVPTKARSPDLSRRSIAKPGKQSTLRTLVTAASDLVNSAVTDQSKHSESAETEPSNFIAKSVTEEKKIMNDVVQPTLSLQKAANEKTTKSKQFADSLSLALQSIEPVESSTKSEVLSDNTPTITLQ
ncbi:hypothetical protein BCR33DRAFT_404747 [Rhizoclosmatium globosum]|uniref:Uncharacterized protein n=1 Tax=Rhizoclosmatium globosum TaxID=329046 RepID=A0A1Y2CYS7_9FUNG|nr:hypothetical protein BCR33DRAFT_404747 [Rhizoclosmatium globosum]|eukprot:ORY51984.1 hypothetical protein BCR33DRAFT_404747 [Rhizoclosmatium globosum]